MKPRVIPKAALARNIRRIQKETGATYAQALEINRREHRREHLKQHASSIKAANSLLHRLGWGVNRGLYMETPVGMHDGKMKFQWGRKLSYRGGTTGRSALIIAMEAFQLDPERFFRQFRTYRTTLMGEYFRKCRGCQEAFVSTRSDALCCSAKCRKRVSRMKDVTLNAR
jgi:hypothetical protein